MIKELVSGLIGAVIASLLTALYLWMSDVRKLRGETYVETAAFFDEIWQKVQNIHAHYDLKSRYDRGGYPNAEVLENMKRQSERISEDRHAVTALINSTGSRAKLAYAYGEGDELRQFNEIVALLRRVVTDHFSSRNTDRWESASAELHRLFSESLDPARAQLERRLMRSTQSRAILQELPGVLRKSKAAGR